MLSKIKYRFFFKDEKGVVAIIVAIALVAIVGIAAYAIDVGGLYEEKAAFQSAVDAAALAGAQDLPDTSEAINVANEYIQLNGYSPSEISITFSDSELIIYIDGLTTYNYHLAGVLGFNSSEVAAHAAAEKIEIPGGFAIFSGSDLELIFNHDNIDIIGSVHTNGDFKANGDNISIDGVCEAVGEIEIDGENIEIPNQEEGAEYIDLIEYVESIHLPDLISSELATAKTYNGDVKIENDLNQNINVKGKVEIVKNVQINGSIIASGDIYIDASGLVMNSPVIYSKNGKIEIKKGNITVNGILYSKNSDVIINNSGGTVTVNGRIVAEFVRLNGPGITVDTTSLDDDNKFMIKLIE